MVAKGKLTASRLITLSFGGLLVGGAVGRMILTPPEESTTATDFGNIATILVGTVVMVASTLTD